MVELKLVTENDAEFWRSADGNVSADSLKSRIADGTGFIISVNQKQIGVLAFNKFWDEIPFLSLIKILPEYRRQGFGREALSLFEKYLKDLGYESLLTSTQTDETAQNFYRKIGYKECGCLVFGESKFRQSMEMFFIKDI